MPFPSMPSEMSTFSARIRQEILADFPAWAEFAVAETFEGSQPYLVVTVPAPPEADTVLPLRISTWGDEVSVDFDYYHSHFDRWNPEDGDDWNRSALFFVHAILEDEVAAASFWQGDHCKLCCQLRPGEPAIPAFDVDHSRVRVRSWSGALNVDRAV